MTRVLHVVDDRKRRGAQVFARDLMGALDRRGIEQRVIVLMDDDGRSYPVAEHVVERTAGSSWLGAAREVRATIGSFRPDVIQTHGGDTLKHVALAVPPVPVVARYIGSAPPRIRTGLRRLAYARLYGRCRLVIAVARALVPEVRDMFGVASARVAAIPNAVDGSRLLSGRDRDAVRRELDVAPGTFVSASFGALVPEKDPHAALDVVERVAGARPDIVHLFVGDGPLGGSLRARVSGGALNGSVRFLGWRDDIADWIAASDAVVLTSRRDGMEGMPAALIEAGWLGVPSVGFGVAGVGEVIQDGVTGSVVAAGDVSAAAAALVGLAVDADRRARIGAAARSRCREAFDISNVADRYADAYSRVGAVRTLDGVAS